MGTKSKKSESKKDQSTITSLKLVMLGQKGKSTLRVSVVQLRCQMVHFECHVTVRVAMDIKGRRDEDMVDKYGWTLVLPPTTSVLSTPFKVIA